MFYCDDCAKEKGWPLSAPEYKDSGKCDNCGQICACNKALIDTILKINKERQENDKQD